MVTGKITWDEATTILGQKIIDGVNAKGADSIATYNTGQWTLEEYYAFGKLAKGAIEPVPWIPIHVYAWPQPWSVT